MRNNIEAAHKQVWCGANDDEIVPKSILQNNWNEFGSTYQYSGKYSEKLCRRDFTIHTYVPVQFLGMDARSTSDSRTQAYYLLLSCLAGKHAFLATIHTLADSRLAAWLFRQPPIRSLTVS